MWLAEMADLPRKITYSNEVLLCQRLRHFRCCSTQHSYSAILLKSLRAVNITKKVASKNSKFFTNVTAFTDLLVSNSAYFDTITFTTTNFFADESYFASQMIVIVCLILFVMCLCVILELILMRRLPPVTTALYSIEVWNTQRKGELNFKFLAIAVSPACKKTEWWGDGMVICLERGADLHMAQLKPLPLTVSCFSKI